MNPPTPAHPKLPATLVQQQSDFTAEGAPPPVMPPVTPPDMPPVTPIGDPPLTPVLPPAVPPLVPPPAPPLMPDAGR